MNVRAVRNRFGLPRALQYAAYRLLQRVLVLDITHVMVMDLRDIAVSQEADQSLEYRFLSPEEVREFAKDPSNELDANLATRLELGYDFCFAAIADGRLASYCWLALDSVETEHNRATADPRCGVAMSYSENTAFRYKGFTHPAFRGQRIYQRLAERASAAMAKHGVRYILSTAEWVNFGALQSSYRGGYKFLGIVCLVGWRDWLFAFGPAALADRGILLGRSAKVLRRDEFRRLRGAELKPWPVEDMVRREAGSAA